MEVVTVEEEEEGVVPCWLCSGSSILTKKLELVKWVFEREYEKHRTNSIII